MEYEKKRTWAEVKLNNIKDNFLAIKRYIPKGCKFLGVVKADAYGHGSVSVAKLLQENGADYLAVSCLDEAVELRNNGISMPILILGHTPAEFTGILIDKNITQTVSCKAKAEEYSKEAVKLRKNLKIHIKVDSGMSRLGFICSGNAFDEGVENIRESCKLPGLISEGIYTHFAVSDEEGEKNKEYTLEQFKLFTNVIEALKKDGISFEIRHCANSGAVVNYPEMCLDMVRPGLLLYGYGDPNNRIGLKPCMSLYTTISTIKVYEPGTSISYGCKFVTERKTSIAVLGIGYADGLPRITSGKCSYYTKDGDCPQCGNICMDMCMMDITDAKTLDVGDIVEIFGENKNIESLSQAAQTIPYEIMCSISKRVPRIYI